MGKGNLEPTKVLKLTRLVKQDKGTTSRVVDVDILNFSSILYTYFHSFGFTLYPAFSSVILEALHVKWRKSYI